MNDELERWLDGDAHASEITPDARAEMAWWNEVHRTLREDGAPGMPAGLEGRVMRGVLAEGPVRRSQWRGLLGWWLRPSLRIPPLAAGLAAAALAVLLLRLPATQPAPEAGTSAAAGEAGAVYVEFLLEAPAARSVALAGDFNGWTPSLLLQDTDGDGVWAGRIRLEPGVHKYMFVVDDSRWVTDPQAERYVDDGFGNRNAVVAVLTPAMES